MTIDDIASFLEAKGLTHLAADLDSVAVSVEAASNASLADAMLFGSFTDTASGKVVTVNRWSTTGEFEKEPSAPEGKAKFTLMATDRKGVVQKVPMWLFTGSAHKKSGEVTEFEDGVDLSKKGAPAAPAAGPERAPKQETPAEPEAPKAPEATKGDYLEFWSKGPVPVNGTTDTVVAARGYMSPDGLTAEVSDKKHGKYTLDLSTFVGDANLLAPDSDGKGWAYAMKEGKRIKKYFNGKPMPAARREDPAPEPSPLPEMPTKAPEIPSIPGKKAIRSYSGDFYRPNGEKYGVTSALEIERSGDTITLSGKKYQPDFKTFTGWVTTLEDNGESYVPVERTHYKSGVLNKTVKPDAGKTKSGLKIPVNPYDKGLPGVSGNGKGVQKDMRFRGIKFYGATNSGTEYRTEGKPRPWLDAITTGWFDQDPEKQLLAVFEPTTAQFRQINPAEFTGKVTFPDGTSQELDNGPNRAEMKEAVEAAEANKSEDALAAGTSSAPKMLSDIPVPMQDRHSSPDLLEEVVVDLKSGKFYGIGPNGGLDELNAEEAKGADMRSATWIGSASFYDERTRTVFAVNDREVRMVSRLGPDDMAPAEIRHFLEGRRESILATKDGDETEVHGPLVVEDMEYKGVGFESWEINVLEDGHTRQVELAELYLKGIVFSNRVSGMATKAREHGRPTQSVDKDQMDLKLARALVRLAASRLLG